MKIAIVKYNAGNTCSLSYALERIGVDVVVTEDERELRRADKVVFPGVGEASSAMEYLRERNLDHVLRSLTQPFLGICLGLQLMCSHSEEGDVDCLGIFPQRVRAFRPVMKVPQIGWNNLLELQSPLFKNLEEVPYVYFVHGYYAELGGGTIARANYILDYSAALHRDNFYATQFHPEKSGKVGEQILRNFIEL